MTVGFALLDYAVLGVCLAAMLALGAWAGRGQQSSDDFSFAGRTLSAWPLGLSLASAGLCAALYCGAPNEAYYAGMRLLLVPVMAWAALPVVFWCTVPLYGNLDLDSVYEYLELRYNPPVRVAAAGTYVVCQLLWLSGVLALPCQVLQGRVGLSASAVLLLVAAATTAILYTFLGGIKATVWTGVVQLALMAAGVLLLVLAIGHQLDGGLPRVWETAVKLGRNTILDTTADWSAKWSIWVTLPYLALAPMFFYLADQATVQRLLAARSDQDMKLSFLLGNLLFGAIVVLVMYVGLGLLAVYHNRAQTEIPPHWVANIARHPRTGQPLLPADATLIHANTIGSLVVQGALLDPNTDRPLTDTEGLVDDQGEVVIDRLATRATQLRDGERLLRAGRSELLSRFIRRHMPAGLAGLVLAALLAGAMSVLAAGLTALTTLAIVDFHRRLGWGEAWLARHSSKQPDELDGADEILFQRPLVLVFGTAVVLMALVITATTDAMGWLLGTLNVLAGPLLGVFLLGLFTRRTTAPAALAAMVLGVLTALWATLGHHLDGVTGLSRLWPFPSALGCFWPLLLGLAATLLAGYGLSFLIGRQKSREELTGLVVGLGPLGFLADADKPGGAAEEVVWIGGNERETQGPWRQ